MPMLVASANSVARAALAIENAQLLGALRSLKTFIESFSFVNMVPVGSRVRARAKLLAVEPKSGGMQMTTEVTIEIDGQAKPACVAETISLVFK